jgi:nicotinamidase-related amidase
MPITTLDPKTALVVIDLQNGIVALPVVHPAADVVAKSRSLAEAFRAQNLPVVLVTVAPTKLRRADSVRNMPSLPSGWTDLVPELGAQPSDHRITKESWGAFSGTGLEAWLKSQGITQIVLCGIATSIGVETTARQAYEAGFNIAFAIDAMSDMVAEAHQNSVTRIFPRLGETGATEDIVGKLGAA